VTLPRATRPNGWVAVASRHRVTGDWLAGDAYYRGRFLAGDNLIDNPDQRIQQDIDIFTTGTGPETNTPTVGTSQTLVFGRSRRSSPWFRSPRFFGVCRAH
jgi:hypothetical protein